MQVSCNVFKTLNSEFFFYFVPRLCLVPMRQVPTLLFLSSILFFCSCKKQRQHHVEGTLENEVTGNGHNMGGETIHLYSIKSSATFDIFSNPDKIIFIAEATTNEEGHFDFGVQELKAGDYRIDYVQGNGKTYYGVKNSFKDISVDNDDGDFNEKISIIPTAHLSCFASPLWNTNLTDTLTIEFRSETRLKYNSTQIHSGQATGYFLAQNSFPYNTVVGVSNEYMGRFFLKITKSYNGVRTITRDTIFVEKDSFYKYYTSF